MAKSLTNLPPQVIQHFSSLLLSTASPKLRDGSHTFESMFARMEKMWHKLDGNPIRRARCELLKTEILELYERAAVKEKERESQKNHKTQEFGYYVALPKGLASDVYWRLRFGCKSGERRYE